jgi:hypothetical protein
MLSFEMNEMNTPKKETTLSLSSPAGGLGKAFVFSSKQGEKGVETSLMTAKKLVFSSFIKFPPTSKVKVTA